MLIYLLALLALSSMHYAIAMDGPLPKRSHKTITLQPREVFEPFQLNWPQEVTLLDFDEPITDELLLELNAGWRAVRDNCTAETKEQIFREVQEGILAWALLDRDIDRTLKTLLVCVGCDPDLKTGGWSPMEYSANYNDVQFAKYLLQKGATLTNCLGKCITVEMAKLFIDHGAQIPENILYKACASAAQAELLQFYLNMGYIPKPDEDGNTPFHGLMGWHGPHQDQKTRLLLQFAPDLDTISYQNHRACTTLHAGLMTGKKEICMILINHYIDQHQNFITLLGCIKKKYPDFYRHKDIRYCFKEFSPMKKLRHLLSLKDQYGKIAYQISRSDEFSPETCTYNKFIKLRNPEQQSKRAKTDPIEDEKQ